jgi:hypothetical protein
MRGTPAGLKQKALVDKGWPESILGAAITSFVTMAHHSDAFTSHRRQVLS